MTEVVFALYKPKAGKESELEALLAKHVPILRELKLITSRPRLTLKSADGTYIEIFEWNDSKAAYQAHENIAISNLWEEISSVADFKRFSDLTEAANGFAHYKVVPQLSDLFP